LELLEGLRWLLRDVTDSHANTSQINLTKYGPLPTSLIESKRITYELLEGKPLR
jgi:hypothetical protein